MITQDLYKKVLVEPASESGDRLCIVSGYASAAFAADHLQDMLTMPSRPIVHLLVGMFPQIGNLRSNHLAFQQLSTTDYPIGFECRYVVTSPPVHVKAYAWHRNGLPLRGFVGSANYSRNGFADQQREAVTVSDAQEVQNYFDDLWTSALDCRDPQADILVGQAITAYHARTLQAGLAEDTTNEEIAGLPHVCLTLLAENGDIHQGGGGLNWGQRPGREPNQAYIPVPAAVGRLGFFPPLKQHFTLMTDDGHSLICVPAEPKQKGGTVPHAIHTPLNNSDMGLYFRYRLGVPSGAFITKQNLLDYGRTDVVIYSINDDDYYMDFSTKKAL
jgi:hypothetical protein